MEYSHPHISYPNGMSASPLGFDPDPAFLRMRVAAAQARLLWVRADFVRDSVLVEQLEALLFKRLRGAYEKRDRLRLDREFKQRMLAALTLGRQDLVQQLLEDHERAKFHLADQYECAEAQFRKRDSSARVELGRSGVHAPAMDELPVLRDWSKPSGASAADTLAWRHTLAALEVETLKLEREHDALRDSEGFAFAREAQEDRDLVNRTVEERVESAEAESAELTLAIARLEELIRSFQRPV